jgi:tetratricopeptide (TPR) repeat protein
MAGELGDGRELLAAGAAEYEGGNAAAALRIFEDAARRTEGRIRLAAMVNAASMADQLGRHERAAEWFRSALAQMPAEAGAMRPSALVNLSQALQHLGDLDGAQSALREARALLTEDPDMATVRVACLLSSTAVAIHRQQWPAAIELATESLDAAVRFAPHLAGHPLMNLAAAYFETGRRELALDFAQQALDAFTAAGNRDGVAETQQNLALMHIRSERPDAAEPLLLASQRYFEQAGLGPRAGIGLKALGFLAESGGDQTRAYDLYARGLDRFTAAGAVLEAADARIRVATAAFSLGRPDEAAALLDVSFRVFAERGLGLHCAQIDYWHAALLESGLDYERPDPATVTRALRLAVPAALALDAVRHCFANGGQRRQWNHYVAEPAIRLAFRFAYLSGAALLVADLIETQCAGSVLNLDRVAAPGPVRLPLVLPDPPGDSAPGTVYLGAALAEVAADAGLPVAPPPRLRVEPGDRIALAEYIAAAETRYGRRVRDDLVLRA